MQNINGEFDLSVQIDFITKHMAIDVNSGTTMAVNITRRHDINDPSKCTTKNASVFEVVESDSNTPRIDGSLFRANN